MIGYVVCGLATFGLIVLLMLLSGSWEIAMTKDNAKYQESICESDRLARELAELRGE